MIFVTAVARLVCLDLLRQCLSHFANINSGPTRRLLNVSPKITPCFDVCLRAMTQTETDRASDDLSRFAGGVC